MTDETGAEVEINSTEQGGKDHATFSSDETNMVLFYSPKIEATQSGTLTLQPKDGNSIPGTYVYKLFKYPDIVDAETFKREVTTITVKISDTPCKPKKFEIVDESGN